MAGTKLLSVRSLSMLAVLAVAPCVAFQQKSPSNSLFPSTLLRLAKTVQPLRYQNGNEETKDYAGSSFQKEKARANDKFFQTGAHLSTIQSMALSQAGGLLGVTSLAAVLMMLGGQGIHGLSTIHWNNAAEFKSLWDFQLTWIRMFEGLIATIPMIYFEKAVSDSADRDATHVNFRKTNMVMTLFGRRRHGAKQGTDTQDKMRNDTSMPEVILLSLLIAVSSGVSEEIIFRGFLPAFVTHMSHSVPLALLSQALLFGIGHVSPSGTSGQNKVVGGLQTANGLWSGMVYLVAGGDILPCIISHVLYDLHVFTRTWVLTNDQMDYTEDAMTVRLTPQEQQEVLQIKEQSGSSLNAETIAFATRFFFSFDYEHRGSLSRSDVQRAISYAFLQDKELPSEERVDDVFGQLLQSRQQVVAAEDERRLLLSEFLRMLFVLKARSNST